MTEKRRRINFMGSTYYVTPQGHVENSKHHRIKPFNNGRGYLCVSLNHQGIRKNFYVHRLVAIYFIPNPKGLPEVNHIDGNKENNDVSNLEWISQKGNMQHAARTGLLPTGQNNWNANLNGDQAKLVFEAYWAGIPAKDIMRAFGVSRHTVNDIARKRIYKSELEELKNAE